MASFERGRWSITEQTISRFILNVTFLINHNPLLLLGLFFQVFYAAIQYLAFVTTQTGSIVFSWRNTPQSSEVHDGDASNPYVFSSGKTYLNNSNPLIKIEERDSAFESESVEAVENTTHILRLKNHPFDLQDTYKMSSPGIQDIVILPGKFGSKNWNIAAAKKREDIGLFQRYGVPSFWSAGASGISSNKGTELGDEDVNFEMPMTRKATKVPKEHTYIDQLCYQPGALKLNTTSYETERPSEAETTQENSSDSEQKGGQAIPDTGKPAAQVSKSPTGSNSYCRSSSGSGGDDGDDGPRRNVPPGGCQGDNQCCMDDSEELQQQADEQSHQGGDCPHNKDYMSTPTHVPSDTGNSKDKTGTSNQKEGQTPTDGGKPVGQVSETQQGSTNYRRSSSGSGGDDGGEDRKHNLPSGGCQGDSQCEVDDLEETEPCKQGDHQEEQKSLPQITENILVSASSCDGTKRSAAQGLRIDVTGARMIAEASFESQEQPNDLQSEAAGGLTLRDQCHPETDLRETEQRLQKAFSCRHSLNSENEWKKCGEASCQEVQEYLSHSQNCHMRVLGGCKKCIYYKESLLYHASRCHLPMGACVVQKCDTIREYLKENRIPDNRKWFYQLDKLFFRPSPPATPTSSPEKGDHIDQHFMAQLLQAEAAFSSRSEVRDIDDADNLNHQPLTSSIEESLRESSGVWNQYHVDRPPDFLSSADQQSDLLLTSKRSSDAQVTRGPTVNAQVRLEQHVSDGRVESTAPLSAACMPDIRQTVKPITQEEQGEVIWPLDQRVLSVGEDGSYIEGVHWWRVKYIGGGSCGRCYFCEDANTRFLFAIKIIPLSKFQQMEIDVWGSISGQHPNILELYGAIKHKEAVVIFMEYMEGGSVEEYGKLHEVQAVHILGKVISAVKFMHSRRLLHGDIKGGNVLVDDTGQKVKLADFGTTTRCDSYLKDNSPRGTEPFMAPEVCRSEQHSFSADIWGLMCFLYQMLVGRPPWMEFHCGSLLFKIGMASQPPQSPPCSPEVEDFFSQGFVLEPSERATAAELLQHPVFVTAPCVSNIPLPSREENEDEDGNFSSDTSDSYTESLASEQSSDTSTTDFEAGNGSDDQEEEMDSDDDDDSNSNSEASDGYDDGNRDMLEPDLLGVEAAMFIEGPWQGIDLPAEEQLQSLQSGLFLSLEGEDLERVLSEMEENADVNDNDINLLKGGDFNVDQFLGQLLGDADLSSTQPLSGAFATPEWSYSITDLTKVHIKDCEGNLVFTIRERPSTSYGNLGEEHHGNIASVLKLDAFTLTREDGTPLNACAEIGSEEQAIRVVRAHDTDNWQPYRWRVDCYGRVEHSFEM